MLNELDTYTLHVYCYSVIHTIYSTNNYTYFKYLTYYL